MKRIELFCFLILSFLSVNTKAELPVKQYFLDNYRIPVNHKGAYVGRFISLTSNEKLKVKLLQDTANLFSISKEGIIRLKRNMAIKESSLAFRYAVKTEVNGSPIELELVKDDFIKNKVIAHRGAWKKAKVAQNSIRSLDCAFKLGCAGSEFDVWLSSDNVAIISHDSKIGELSIEKSTYRELSNVVLPTGDKVPTLEEYLTEGKIQNKTALILEIKSSDISNERTLELTDSIISIVHRMKAQAWVEYISFSYDALKHVHKLDPMAKTAYLSGDKTVNEVKADNITGIDYSFYSYMSDSNLVHSANNQGLTTNVWTVNTREEFETYLDKRVDYITTDEPELLLQIIEEENK
ncbi:glycerophosphodiester phosphodiesterase family protein [uncultured Bacteroides sp.]|uniref:glycerophosphodiester phosphodiesterase family protein n=1 Tax=uncultured Bacteroides sp. TaxID=162156 RepID=UPI002AAB040F|nr:glycerophosphodiester phosphodiesterase family protein [uncultured Bacteroides sp.]